MTNDQNTLACKITKIPFCVKLPKRPFCTKLPKSPFLNFLSENPKFPKNAIFLRIFQICQIYQFYFKIQNLAKKHLNILNTTKIQ